MYLPWYRQQCTYQTLAPSLYMQALQRFQKEDPTFRVHVDKAPCASTFLCARGQGTMCPNPFVCTWTRHHVPQP